MKPTKIFSEYFQYCKENNIDITKWNSYTLSDKLRNGKILSEPEYLAKLFLEESGKYMKEV